MKILAKEYNEVMTVYAVYWLSNNTYFYCIPAQHEGIIAFELSEVEVVDKIMGSNFVFFQDGQILGLFHPLLFVSNFLERLLDCETGAVDEFNSALKN